VIAPEIKPWGKPHLNRGEVVSGVVLAALGVFVVTEAARWEYLGPDGPGPGFFPMWYGMAMVALAAVLVVQNVMSRAAVAGKPANWREVGRVLVAWGGFVVSVALLKLLGFILSFGLFVLFVVAGLYRRPLRVAIAVAVGCAAGFYLVFPFALDVRLPIGILGF
jgi:putative tricarboxylic transport membrane protein